MSDLCNPTRAKEIGFDDAYFDGLDVPYISLPHRCVNCLSAYQAGQDEAIAKLTKKAPEATNESK